MDNLPFLIVGLGNPGQKYENTRHNVGFAIVDQLNARWGGGTYAKKFKGALSNARYADRKIVLLKPQTYMNLSGEAAQPAAAFYKIDPAKDMLVISDDLDLPTGRLRMRSSGGSGGHNGLKSIVASLGTNQFPRLRVGIGRDERADSSSHVLGKIKGSEKKTVLRRSGKGS